jgi:hypothetical protein
VYVFYHSLTSCRKASTSHAESATGPAASPTGSTSPTPSVKSSLTSIMFSSINMCSTTFEIQDEPACLPPADAIVKPRPPSRPCQRQLRFRGIRHPRRHCKYRFITLLQLFLQIKKNQGMSMLAVERDDQPARASRAVQQDEGQNHLGRLGGPWEAARPAVPVHVRC